MGEISLEVARGLWRKHDIAFPEVLGAVNGPGKVHGQLKLLVAGSSTSWGHCSAHMTQPERHACMAPCMAGHVTAKTPLLVTGAWNRSAASSLRSSGLLSEITDRRQQALTGAIIRTIYIIFNDRC